MRNWEPFEDYAWRMHGAWTPAEMLRVYAPGMPAEGLWYFGIHETFLSLGPAKRYVQTRVYREDRA